MKTTKNNLQITTIFCILMVTTIAIVSVLVPIVSCEVFTETTVVLLAVEPNPIGVGQVVYLNLWIEPIPPSATLRYNGITCNITFPDGTVTTLGPETGGPLGNVVWDFIPPSAGTYKLVATIPTHTFQVGQNTIIREGSSSPVIDLVVQTEQVLPLPEVPLPSEYWTYPIDAQNRLWAQYSGSWLGGDTSRNMYPKYDFLVKFNPYTTGPQTAHVLWTKQQAFGGIEGGDFGAVAYAEGHMYEGKNAPGIIINGRYYTYHPHGDRLISEQTPLSCIDLATGEIIWQKQIPNVAYGQIFEYQSVNQVGLHAYLWSTVGSNLVMYDAFNGNRIGQFVGVRSGGTNVFDDIGSVGGNTCKGAILTYYIDTQAGWMAMWNQTKAFDLNGLITYQSTLIREERGVAGGQWRPRDAVGDWNWSLGWEWNVTIPSEQYRMTSFTAVPKARGYGITLTSPTNDYTLIYGYSLDNDNPRKLWGPVNFTAAVEGAVAMGNGLFIRSNPKDMSHYAWNLTTGNLEWVSDPAGYPWGAYADTNPTVAYDRMFVALYDGVHCYNMSTGREEWFFDPGDSGYDTPYSTWVPRFSTTVVGGETLYFSTGAWKPEPVVHRGDRAFAVDVYTGQNIWNISFFSGHFSLANGYLVGFNGYDGKIYCFNKGPSATTVTVDPAVTTAGKSLMIRGRITDISPSTLQPEIASRFPNGLPAIADKHMTEWMEYVHMQKSCPSNLEGVVVRLSIRDPNGDYYETRVASNADGLFSHMWNPGFVGEYQVTATFEGSDAYWPSYSTTTFGMDPAPAPAMAIEPEEPTKPAEYTTSEKPAVPEAPTTPEQPAAPEEPTIPEEPEPIVEAHFISIEIAIVAVVAVAFVIGVVSYWVLKKRK